MPRLCSFWHGGLSLSSLAECRVRLPQPCVAMAEGDHGLPTLRDSSACVGLVQVLPPSGRRRAAAQSGGARE